jgi:hypothetical protein
MIGGLSPMCSPLGETVHNRPVTTQRGEDAVLGTSAGVVSSTPTAAEAAAHGDATRPGMPWGEEHWDAFTGAERAPASATTPPAAPDGPAPAATVAPPSPTDRAATPVPVTATNPTEDAGREVAPEPVGPADSSVPADDAVPAGAADGTLSGPGAAVAMVASDGVMRGSASAVAAEIPGEPTEDAAGGPAGRSNGWADEPVVEEAPADAWAERRNARRDGADEVDDAVAGPGPVGAAGQVGAVTAPAVDGGGRHQWSAATEPPTEKRDDGFDPSDTGTWRVREVVPGGESGRRTTTILQYLLGRLAVDNIRGRTRWWYAIPGIGLLLSIIVPWWVAGIVVVLGVVLVIGRLVMLRLIERLSLARRFRPVEEDLRSAVEAGKANLRGELRRVGLPSGPWTLPLSLLRLARGSARSEVRSRLLEIEIDRVLPRAQLDRALRLLDQAGQGR